MITLQEALEGATNPHDLRVVLERRGLVAAPGPSRLLSRRHHAYRDAIAPATIVTMRQRAGGGDGSAVGQLCARAGRPAPGAPRPDPDGDPAAWAIQPAAQPHAAQRQDPGDDDRDGRADRRATSVERPRDDRRPGTDRRPAEPCPGPPGDDRDGDQRRRAPRARSIRGRAGRPMPSRSIAAIATVAATTAVERCNRRDARQGQCEPGEEQSGGELDRSGTGPRSAPRSGGTAPAGPPTRPPGRCRARRARVSHDGQCEGGRDDRHVRGVPGRRRRSETTRSTSPTIPLATVARRRVAADSIAQATVASASRREASW